MRRRDVVFSPEAQDDLLHLYDWISQRAGAAIAEGFIARIEACCMGLDLASERGTLRDDIRPGLRVIGFERKLAIAFVVDKDRVIVLRLFHGGQDWEREL